MPLTNTKAIREWKIERPCVAFGKGFGVLALLFAVCTPFVAKELPTHPLLFFFAGLAYSALLVFFVTGLGLIPGNTRGRVVMGLSIAGFAGILLQTAMWVFAWVCYQRGEYELFFPVLRHAFWPLILALGLVLAVAFGFSCYGWYWRYWGGGRERREG